MQGYELPLTFTDLRDSHFSVVRTKGLLYFSLASPESMYKHPRVLP
jgi:hypothetical protein